MPNASLVSLCAPSLHDWKAGFAVCLQASMPAAAGRDASPAADAIKAVATKYNLPTIDLYSAFLGHPELYRAQPMKDAEGEHVLLPAMAERAALLSALLSALK